MKTTVSTFALSLALCAAAGATAQTKNMAPAPKADTVMLSETTDGDYKVRKFIVSSQNDSDYSIRYLIGQAKLNKALDGNTMRLDELNAFMGDVMKDSLKKVKTVTITGYASPDGPLKYNEALAKNRAWDFKNFLDKKYNLSKMYDVKVSSMVDDWEATRMWVAQSSMPDKAKVLEIIDGKQWTSAEKQAALEKMPAAWDYLAKNILPSLRRVELAINYDEGNLVEQRMMIPKPKPAPAPAAEKPCNPCCVVVDETVTGLIVEMPSEEYSKEARHEWREADKMTKDEMKAANKQAKEAQKLAKVEARKAEKIGKEAAKMAKKAEKAAAKMAKEQAKADRKAAKAMSKM